MSKVSFSRRKIAVASAAILAATAAASSAPAARAPVFKAAPAISHGLKPDTAPVGTDCTTGTSAPFYCLGAENDSTQNGFTDGVYGVEGYAPKSTGGVGVLGYSGSSSVNSAYGVYGVTFAPSGIGVYGAGDGPAPATGATPGSNVSTGVVGDSHAGDGIYGSTEWPNSSNTGQIGGVFGIDNTDADFFNSGVVGMTTNGAYGVFGMGSNDSKGTAIGGVGGISTTNNGVYGGSTSGYGVHGSSASNYGLYASTNSGPAGVYGYSTTTTGVSGTSGGGSGVVGTSSYTGQTGGNGVFTGVTAMSTQGDAIYAKSTSFVGAYIENDTASLDTVVIKQDVSGANPLVVEGASNDLLNLDSSGNLEIRGTLTASDTSFARTRNPNTDMLSYSAQVAEPTMEDVGSAHLVNGSAAVALGADFRQTIDGSSRYMVFLTPYGDNNGLYVASRTAGGFVVRESHGGRSTMDFDYRIVAKQYGATKGRLPRASMLHLDAMTARDAQDGGRPSAATLAKLKAAGTKPAESAKDTAFERAIDDGSAFRNQRFTPRANKLVENRLR